MEGTDTTTAPPVIASGEKAKARDIIAAIRTLASRSSGSSARPPPTSGSTLARFGGFGAVALSLFPDPVTGRYKDAGWQALGDELKSLLTPEEYDSRQADDLQRRSTPRPSSSQAMHEAIWPASACPTTPPCSSRAAAPAISWPRPRRACGSSASSWTASPAASPAPCTPTPTSASRTSATPSCPRAASTP